MPKNIESYYQEAGRAGRDGSPAECLLLYSGQDVRINEYLITHSEEEPVPALQAHNRELLKQMTFYAAGAVGNNGSSCLRRRLLAYFGEESPPFCGNCSNCNTEYEETDITLEARKIISCVYRLKERNRSFGKTMIIDILRGSSTEKIRRFGFDTLSVWGIMSGTKAHRIRAILDFLIDDGCLRAEGDEYPIITLGCGIEEILREERSLSMKLPREHSGTHNSPPELRKSKAPDAAPNENIPAPATDGIPESECLDKVLFEKLRELRREFATKEGVPAYIIFTDASLRDMCRKKPVSLSQFSAVNGVGTVKRDKYGEAFVRAIQNSSIN